VEATLGDRHQEEAVVARARGGAAVAVARRHQQRAVVEGQNAAQPAELADQERLRVRVAWPLISLKDNRLFTLPIGLLYLQGQFGSDDGATMAFALVNVVPTVVVFLVFQRSFVQGFARSGLR
jgi:hypothetical protein